MPDRHLIVYESAGCPFFSIATTRDFLGRPAYDESCRETRRQAFDEIRATGADVIVAQSWWNMPLTSETASETWSFDSDAEFADFAATELQRLKADLGIVDLVVIGNVPTNRDQVSPLDCIGRPVRLNEVRCATTPLNDPELRWRAEVNAVLRARSPRRHDVRRPVRLPLRRPGLR